MGGEATTDSIRAILAICPTDSGYPRSHLLVCLCLLYYAPEAMLGGKIPLALSKQIAAVLAIKHPSVYIARNKIASWLKVYPDFRKLIRGLFAELPAVTATP